MENGNPSTHNTLTTAKADQPTNPSTSPPTHSSTWAAAGNSSAVPPTVQPYQQQTTTTTSTAHRQLTTDDARESATLERTVFTSGAAGAGMEPPGFFGGGPSVLSTPGMT
eukprot:TRINITY_DN59758_c0_g1_i1.p1 TRINITY_DN59758_c0_g1~~TRINITY_DN59758_c0_g1_i1.p1  ORF type:complete len:110 (+),score=18.96 TRINITY_DN59758_c0_g1_i1:190-519(+)